MSHAVSSPSGFRSDLIRQYSRPGPRYTSYPTALYFHQDGNVEEWLRPWRDPVSIGQPLSLYLHLPFCESLCWFCGCTKVITTQRGVADRYLDYLERELELWMGILPGPRPLAQLHLGGGTPTFLSDSQLQRLGEILLTRWTPSAEAEFGVEIDPRRLQRDQVEVLRQIGFNRASLGVQDHDPVVQQAVHRIQPREQTWQAVQWLRESGFRSINVDLIYGLPHQTADSFAATVRDIIELRPERIALFGYAHIPWMRPSQKIFDQRAVLPSEEVRLEILQESNRLLMESGYVYVGMDHFALANDSLAVAQREGRLRRNFQGYSTGGAMDILALGMSGISQGAHTYHQNEKDLEAYYAALDQGRLPVSGGYSLTDEDRLRRAVIMELMCHLRLDYADFNRQYGIDFTQYFRASLDALQPMQQDGLVEMDEGGLRVTRTGRYLLRNVALHFDAYLQTGEKRYSKTV